MESEAIQLFLRLSKDTIPNDYSGSIASGEVCLQPYFCYFVKTANEMYCESQISISCRNYSDTNISFSMEKICLI